MDRLAVDGLRLIILKAPEAGVVEVFRLPTTELVILAIHNVQCFF